MRMSIPPNSVKERKISQSASCKIDSIIRQLFIPMLSMPLPESTWFSSLDAPEDPASIESLFMQQIAKENPSAVSSEKDFVEYMVQLYQRFQLSEESSQQSQKQRCTKPAPSGSEGLD